VKKFAAAATAALAVGLAVWRGLGSAPAAVAQIRTPVEDSTRQFRVTLGLRDTAPRAWTGRVRASGGNGAELVRVRGWRFSGQDQTSQDGSFWFQTKMGNYEDQLFAGHAYGARDWNDPGIRRHIPQGLLIRARGGAGARLTISFEGEGAPSPIDFALDRPGYFDPLIALDGNAYVERLPVELRLSENGMEDDAPALTIAPDGTPYTAWVAYQDQGDWVVVGDGITSTRITEKGDHQSPAIAALKNGWVLAAWAQRDEGGFNIYTSFRVAGRWTPARRMTALAGSHISPHLAADPDGRAVLVWQSLREGRAEIRMRIFDGRNWNVEEPVNQDPANAWAPTVAALSKRALVAWDSYAGGAYQIWFREWPRAPERVTVGANFSVRPSVAVGPAGQVIVAWEESGPLWGKDFAFLADRRGTPLYQDRRVRLAVRQNGEWLTLPCDPGEALPRNLRRFMQQPQIAFDSAGRLHMLFRARTFAGNSRIDNWAAGGRWETLHTRLEGARWIPATVMPSSEGRNGMRASLAIEGQRVLAAWATDNRSFPQNRYGGLDVYLARVSAAGAPSSLIAPAAAAVAPPPPNPQPKEDSDVARIRAYRVKLTSGKEYRILRGDLHRHTELSADGAGDGSLEDLYRYVLDAAQMDYAHVADHQMGSDEEYNWWLTQKSNDLYFMPQRFVPLYGYERSVPYPNGHRNIIWAERGRPVLKVDPAEQKGAADSGPIVFPYLRRTNGIATAHTSATQQGTDWRDADPALEPIVEIYQGFESSYEHAGAPRAWKEGEKAVHQGVRPAGYIWNAWAKGLKLGVQASSDHVSTHTSFACVLVEDFSRAGLLDAMRRRHTYATTDAIVLDYRAVTSAGEALMGDAGESRTPPRLEIKLIGTAPIAEVEIIKTNTYVHKVSPGTTEVTLSYTDAAFADGESYYYVRARQTDGQLVWSSPIWIKRIP